jgi:hypothetical protein
MGTLFIVSGIVSLTVMVFFVRGIESSESICIQPSLKSILIFWREEAGIKKVIAVVEFYFLYMIMIGIVFLIIGFDPNNLLEFVVGLVILSAPALLYRVIRYMQEKQ